jgi:hypothetical protein
MPRPSVDIIELIISDLTNNILDSKNNVVNVKAGWITDKTQIPIVTVTKIGEWCRVLEIEGMAKEVYADLAIDLWADNYADVYSMAESCSSRLKSLRKAHQDIGIVYMIETSVRRIYEPEIAPLLQHEQIILRLFWFE